MWMLGDKLTGQLLKSLALAGLAGEPTFKNIGRMQPLQHQFGLRPTIGICKLLARIQSSVFTKQDLMERTSQI